MIELLNIVRKPHITEKSTRLKEESQTLCFRVDSRATKIDVRRAVERSFDVKVDGVRLLKVPGKLKRNRGFAGYTSSWRKAYVKLKPGSKTIEFEGMA